MSLYLVKPIECITIKENLSLNYGPWVLKICQYTFINCNMHTTLLEVTDNKEDYACVRDRE